MLEGRRRTSSWADRMARVGRMISCQSEEIHESDFLSLVDPSTRERYLRGMPERACLLLRTTPARRVKEWEHAVALLLMQNGSIAAIAQCSRDKILRSMFGGHTQNHKNVETLSIIHVLVIFAPEIFPLATSVPR